MEKEFASSHCCISTALLPLQSTAFLRTASCHGILRKSLENLHIHFKVLKEKMGSKELEYHSWESHTYLTYISIYLCNVSMHLYLVCIYSIHVYICIRYKYIDVYMVSQLNFIAKKTEKYLFSVITMIHSNRRWCYFCINIISSMWHA